MAARKIGFIGEAMMIETEWTRILKEFPAGGLMLEIGTHDGVTAAHIAKQRPNGTIISLDPYFAGRAILQTRAPNIAAWWKNHQKNQILFVGTARQWKLFAPSIRFDVIFVDGSHTTAHVMDDLTVASLLIKLNGTIIAHDYESDKQVRKGVDSWCKSRAKYRVIEHMPNLAILGNGGKP